jgi:hypothetical protein
MKPLLKRRMDKVNPKKMATPPREGITLVCEDLKLGSS